MAEASDQPKLDKELEKDLSKYEGTDYSSLIKQIDAEWNLAWEHQHEKKQEGLLRLKIYNNQKRDKDAVGDTTLFTIFQTVFASLYIDRLSAEFGGREEGDEEVAENLNQMAEYDYEEMGKDVFDFDWIWDTLFFGRGLLQMTEYIRDPDNNIFVPSPEIIDPTIFLRDPRAVAVNGNTRTGKNAARFVGYEIRMSRAAIESNPNFLKNIKWDELGYGAGTKSLLEDTSSARAEAQGYATPKKSDETELKDNAEYVLTYWLTHWKVNGTLKKVQVWLGNERKTIVGFNEIGDREVKWPIIDRPLYPTAHDWDGTSIPDLTEDKQRHRAVAANLGLRAMAADLYPMYAYDQVRIKNRGDLNFAFNKFIPVDGEPSTAIAPLRKATPNLPLLEFIYNTLDLSAQKATATPEIRQGQVSSEQRTLGEINIVSSNIETRYSLAAKVFGWSERRFWQQWYKLYKDNFGEKIDEKVLRIGGAFGPKWRALSRDNIIAHIDPDIKIESKVLSRAKQLEERVALSNFFTLAFADPTSNRRWGLKKLAKLNGLQKDEIDRLFPPTIDERQAEEENDSLNENKFVGVLREQDHNVHLEVHAKAKLTKATTAHIKTHTQALMIKKISPELFPTPAQSEMASFSPPGSTKPEGMALPTMPIAPSQTSNQPLT
jgi:hypothetical protein